MDTIAFTPARFVPRPSTETVFRFEDGDWLQVAQSTVVPASGFAHSYMRCDVMTTHKPTGAQHHHGYRGDPGIACDLVRSALGNPHAVWPVSNYRIGRSKPHHNQGRTPFQ